MNPLGLIEALIGALNHAAVLQEQTRGEDALEMHLFTSKLRTALHNTFRYGQGIDARICTYLHTYIHTYIHVLLHLRA